MSEADRLNFAEIRKRVLGAFEGGKPGKRKRSYHRALKRGEFWAVLQSSQQALREEINRAIFSNPVISDNCPEAHIYGVDMVGLSALLSPKKLP